MGFWEDYEGAERVQLVDSSRKDSQGRTLYRLLPFQKVRIAGVDYIEPMNQEFDKETGECFVAGAQTAFYRLQDAEMDGPLTYNNDSIALHEFHPGI
jgi:hypothetical protein